MVACIFLHLGCEVVVAGRCGFVLIAIDSASEFLLRKRWVTQVGRLWQSRLRGRDLHNEEEGQQGGLSRVEHAMSRVTPGPLNRELPLVPKKRPNKTFDITLTCEHGLDLVFAPPPPRLFRTLRHVHGWHGARPQVSWSEGDWQEFLLDLASKVAETRSLSKVQNHTKPSKHAAQTADRNSPLPFEFRGFGWGGGNCQRSKLGVLERQRRSRLLSATLPQTTIWTDGNP